MSEPHNHSNPNSSASGEGTGPRSRQRVLALNAGSSSLKFALFRLDSALHREWAGNVDRIGLPDATFGLSSEKTPTGEKRRVSAANHVQALDFVLEQIAATTGMPHLAAVGHRVLHGGERYTSPHAIDAALIRTLEPLSPLGPEHMPAQLSVIAAVAKRLPSLRQVACFDTAFHRDLPRVARLLPVPRRYEAAGVRRYGFHGLSYEFLMEELGRLGDGTVSHGRVILAHLGNGASMAAVRDGKCIDTSMAFTPAAGLVMGRRSGDLDPGLPAFFARTQGMTAEAFDQMANHEAGLLGISETTSDMRELLALEERDVRAAEAIALFCYQAKKWLGAFTAALGGLDTLVFAGGIGENNPTIRARICEGLGFLHLELSESRNADNAAVISINTSRVTVRVIRTDEELMIARSTCRVLGIEGAEKKD